MHIAQVTPQYYPYTGGVETVVKKISEVMVKRGHKVEVLTVDPSRKLPEMEECNRVIVRRFAPAGIFYYSKALGEFLEKNLHRYHLIHSHSLHSFLPYMTTKAVNRNGSSDCRVVITGHYHGRGKTPLTTFLLHFYRTVIKKNILSKASGVTCVSEHEAVLIRSHFGVPVDKMAVIPNGVAIDEIERALPLPAKQTKYLLCVSRLEKYKNIHLSIQAMQFLPPGYHLVIIGDGPYRSKLEQIANSLCLSERVHILGYVNNKDLYSWYKSCDIVLNLSCLEAFGLNVIEGLAAGKPAIVNNGTALGELAKRFDGVDLVDASRIKPKDLAHTIIRRIQAPFSSQRVRLNQYRWENITDQILAYYKTMLNQY